ncbi:hypothetical protein D3C84_761020 [compost metagenome]
MQRRADRCRLANRAIAEILCADLHRGKQQRNSRTGEQMINGQLGRNANTPMAQPGVDFSTALIEGDRLTRLIAERRHRHGLQLLLGNGFGDAVQVQFVVEQIPQR